MPKIASVVLGMVALAAAGCGGSEPGYCSEVSDLEQSVRGLGEVNVVEGGTNALEEALRKVEADARSTVDAARSDFPEETSAVSDSISSLTSSIEQVEGSPTSEQIARVGRDAAATVTSVTNLADATKSECE
jgi:hypothetical protein